ncbi:hypothetical protein QUA20_17000 [Microcoleus sp. Pol7_A1]|uniref:hypothetical protein n=1 Tax=Microcoleus sp. Pol7_A1 TaxID=2818893 RepID=UPI002FD3C616
MPKYLVGYRLITSSMSSNSAAMAKSHSLIMADNRQQHPEIPSSIYRWSSSNFYIYLAVKSNGSGHRRNTLCWLYRAFKGNLFINGAFAPQFVFAVKRKYIKNNSYSTN